MVLTFPSFAFLISLSVFLILYGLCPERWRKYLVLLGSVAFVAVNSWVAALCALGFGFANFILGFCIQNTRFRKAALGFAVATNAVAMVGFKMLNVGVLGMSYYLFSFMSYLVEVYRQTIRAEHDPIRFAGFTFFFPKFTQGPITRYGELRNQLDAPACRMAGVQQGLEYFIIGFALKVLVVDKLDLPWQVLGTGEPGYYNLLTIGYESISTKLAWLAAIDVSLHIFLEWQAYMFMALGIAGALGYKLPQNFNYPYIARTIGDYYRRWHMTLTRWFKDYVYIPLGGSRKGLLRTVVNILLVWLLTSVWHGNGLSVKYVIWALLFAGAVIYDPFWNRRINGDPETAGKPGLLKALLGHIWLILLVPVSVLILWKPASGLNFILWGMIIGVLIVGEKLWKLFVIDKFRIGERLEKAGFVGKLWKILVSVCAHIWVVIPIVVTWVMFHITDYEELKLFLGRLFPGAGSSAGVIPDDFGIYWNQYKLSFYTILGIILCFPLPERLYQRLRRLTVGPKKFRLGAWIVSALLAVLFWYTVYTLQKNGGSNPMGYANF